MEKNKVIVIGNNLRDKEGKINVCLFFASTIPVVRIIEHDVLM
jgi:hypothetical protein